MPAVAPASAGRRLEARGVEPLSLRPSFQTSTCLADRNRERVWRIGARRSLLWPRNNSRLPARSPRHRTKPAVVASSLSGRPAGHVADYLGRESEIVSLSSYFFDSIFYEANESSSACRLDLKSQVETSTPPFQGSANIDQFVATSKVSR